MALYACLTSPQLRVFTSAAPAQSDSNSPRRAQSSVPSQGTMVQKKKKKRVGKNQTTRRRLPTPPPNVFKKSAMPIQWKNTSRGSGRRLPPPPFPRSAELSRPARSANPRPHPRGEGARETPRGAPGQTLRSRLGKEIGQAAPGAPAPSLFLAGGGSSGGTVEVPRLGSVPLWRCHRSPPGRGGDAEIPQSLSRA